MRKLLTIFLLIAGMASAADLDVRHYYVTNNVSSARPAVSRLIWYGGESVKLDLYVRRGTTPVDLSAAGLYPRWEAVVSTNITGDAYIMNTGTVANATNGYITFSLTPELANLPTNTYTSYIKLYQPVGGTNTYVGMAYKSTTRVEFGPSATNFTYQGPFTNAPAYVSQIVMTSDGSAASTGTVWYLDVDIAGNSSVASNTAKVGFTDALVEANASVASNTAKTSYTDAALVAAIAGTQSVNQTTIDNAIQKDGSVTWTGADDHGGLSITNFGFLEFDNGLVVTNGAVNGTQAVIFVWSGTNFNLLLSE